jgi:hypothetical protein
MPRPSHPAPNTRDDREAPLLRKQDGKRKPLIWGRSKAEYFSFFDWTTQIRLNRLRIFAFARMGSHASRSFPFADLAR